MVGRLAGRALGPVMDLVLPEVCWAGAEGAAAFGLAEATREKIAILAAREYCFHCGLTVGPYERHDAKNPCGRCGERELGVGRVARVGVFDEPLVTLVHRMKFGRAWEIARVLAPFMLQAVTRSSEGAGTQVPVDVLAPVPLHWRRKASRGFNQSEELTREVAALGGFRVVRALRRRRATPAQATLDTRTSRLENLRGAFEPVARAGRSVAGKHVWLVDDVTTTGATLHAAASAMRRLPREHKPASINALVVCVTDRQWA